MLVRKIWPIGNFTLCGETYNDVSTGTNVTVNYSPSAGNGIIAWATWCFTSACNTSISGVTATIGDNVNATESCFVASPHSPFISDGNGGAQGGGDFQQHYVWYCPSIPSGVTSFTVTPSNSSLSYLQLNISEWKAGALAASCSPISACFENVDNLGEAGNTTGGTTATLTTSGPTVNANDLIFAVTEVPCCSFTSSSGSGYSGITVAPGATPGMVSEAKAETATGTQTATTTWTGGSAAWFGVIVPIIGTGTAPVVPTVTNVSPNSGTTAGGTQVTITGTNFATGATVTFGAAAATNVVVSNSTTITATTPAGSAGAVTVTVTSSGQSGSLTNGYTYTGAQTPTAPTGLTAAGGGSGPSVAATQSYLNTAWLTSHTTAPFDSTGGDLIILLASAHWGVGFTPSDNFGNTWIPIAGPTTTNLGFDLRTQIWYARNPVVGSGHTITMNLSQALSLVMSVIVVKGSNISSPIDAVSLIGSDNGTYSLNVVSPNITTTGTNDMLVGFVKIDNISTFQSGPGFTQQAGASLTNLAAETAPAANPGSYNASFTLNQAQTWESAVVAVANNLNQASLSWTASSETRGTISRYLVELCQGAGCNSFVQIGTSTTTSYNDTALTASTSYSYRVRAQDTSNNIGPYSSVASVGTPAPVASLPGNLRATSPSNNEIDLSWTASVETGGAISQYLVERCLGANCTNFSQVGTSASTQYFDTGLTSGNTYNYRVRAKDATSNLSPYSNVANATAATPDTQPPSTPGNLIATPGSSGQINLSWTASTDNVGVAGYWVERCQPTNCIFFRIGVSTGTTYSDAGIDTNGLAVGTTYNYLVQATDAAGNLSPDSNVASATAQVGGAGFTLSASPSSLNIAPGKQGTSAITTTLSGGFNSAISLSASGMPSGTTVSFNPTTIAAPGSGNSTMTITVGSSTAFGNLFNYGDWQCRRSSAKCHRHADCWNRIYQLCPGQLRYTANFSDLGERHVHSRAGRWGSQCHRGGLERQYRYGQLGDR